MLVHLDQRFLNIVIQWTSLLTCTFYQLSNYILIKTRSEKIVVYTNYLFFALQSIIITIFYNPQTSAKSYYVNTSESDSIVIILIKIIYLI